MIYIFTYIYLYLLGVFSAALGLALSLKRIVVMPKHMADHYYLSSNMVITYNLSILEVYIFTLLMYILY